MGPDVHLYKREDPLLASTMMPRIPPMEPRMVTRTPRMMQTQEAHQFQSRIVGFLSTSQMMEGSLQRRCITVITWIPPKTGGAEQVAHGAPEGSGAGAEGANEAHEVAAAAITMQVSIATAGAQAIWDASQQERKQSGGRKRAHKKGMLTATNVVNLQTRTWSC